MINWTEEAVRAEADYRRQQLHKLAGQRRTSGSRHGDGWYRWLPRSRRH